MVHYRADAPANLGLALSTEAFLILAHFGSGAQADALALPDERLLGSPILESVITRFVEAGCLISTRYRLGQREVRLSVDEILDLRQRIAIEHVGVLELEAVVLYLLARENQSNSVLCEIGSMTGGSTVSLALGASKSANHNCVLVVDEHQWYKHLSGQVSEENIARWPSTLPAFQENMYRAGVADCIEIRVADTALAGLEHDGAVSLLFMDAGHTLDTVNADLRAWFPKLVPGGVVAIHDYASSGWPDVRVAVDQYRMNFSAFSVHQTLAVGRKVIT